MERHPSFRSSNAQDFYGFLERFRPGTQAHLRATLAPEMIEFLEHGARTDWIPVSLDGPYVTEVTRFLGGPDVARDAYRQFTSQHLVRTPAIRALFDGFVRLFGVSVGTFVRALPGGFQQAYRDVLTIEVVRGERQALVVLSDIAPEVLKYDTYLIMWNGVFLGLYDIAQVEPQLDYRALRGQRRVEATFKW